MLRIIVASARSPEQHSSLRRQNGSFGLFHRFSGTAGLRTGAAAAGAVRGSPGTPGWPWAASEVGPLGWVGPNPGERHAVQTPPADRRRRPRRWHGLRRRRPGLGPGRRHHHDAVDHRGARRRPPGHRPGRRHRQGRLRPRRPGPRAGPWRGHRLELELVRRHHPGARRRALTHPATGPHPPGGGRSPHPDRADPANPARSLESPVTTTDPDLDAEATRRRPSPDEVLEIALFEAKRILVGQDHVIERLFVCAVARGHCLLEGAPGLAKTLAAETMAKVLDGSFKRIQFTPDLMPSDLVGTRVYRPSQEAFDVELGPVFANVVLADEVNRAPAKVQSALLEVMAEGHVSIGGVTHAVPDPFLVLATQNPIENEGVYPLPEAQRDRFLMKVLVDYPNGREEAEIVRRMASHRPVARAVLGNGRLVALQRAADDVFVHDAVLDYAVRLVLATRQPAEHGLGDLVPVIAHGVSPRGTLGLIAAGRALALIRGRSYALPQDVFDVARDVLRHRLLLSYDAIAEGVLVEDVVERLVSTVAAPRVSPSQDGPVVHDRVVAAA
ncbi:MoxR family ATPase [Aquihabitans sp. G128]|nr:MoxR family ATPase [Aquihabitans sp. G128]